MFEFPAIIAYNSTARMFSYSDGTGLPCGVSVSNTKNSQLL